MEKSHQVAWDSLLYYDGLEWQWILIDLERDLDVAYQILSLFGVSKVLLLLVAI